jgi:hypothetical protein
MDLTKHFKKLFQCFKFSTIEIPKWIWHQLFSHLLSIVQSPSEGCFVGEDFSTFMLTNSAIYIYICNCNSKFTDRNLSSPFFLFLHQHLWIW